MVIEVDDSLPSDQVENSLKNQLTADFVFEVKAKFEDDVLGGGVDFLSFVNAVQSVEIIARCQRGHRRR